MERIPSEMVSFFIVVALPVSSFFEGEKVRSPFWNGSGAFHPLGPKDSGSARQSSSKREENFSSRR